MPDIAFRRHLFNGGEGMRKTIRVFTALMAVFVTLLFILYGASGYITPSEIKTNIPESNFINGSFPFSLRYDEPQTVAAQADIQKNVGARLMIFNTFPIKNVSVSIEQRRYVIPGGELFGIRLYTNGLVVSETSEVGNTGKSPANLAGIESGDIILSVNGNTLTSSEQLLKEVENSGGSPVKIRYMKGEKITDTLLTPIYDTSSEKYRAGLYVRDSCAGIGTMTYTDPKNSSFGGLGHGICDNESGCLMPLLSGDIVDADISSVRKGMCGSPGSVCGHFRNNESRGTLILNSEHGVYGKIKNVDKSKKAIPVAFKQEIVRGNAQLISTIDENKPEYYDIEIEDISYNNLSRIKNMVIKVTDERLLRKTGGIVQGMSGSPIIQNGMLTGAVTHVFVNDPSRGYAVFAENMLEMSENISQTIDDSAA